MKKRKFMIEIPFLGTWSFFADNWKEAEEIITGMIQEDEDDVELTDEQKQAMRADEMIKDWKETA